MKPRTVFFAAVVSVGLLVYATTAMFSSAARKPVDCSKNNDDKVCQVTVTADLFFLPPSVGGSQIVVIKKGQKITWVLDSAVYNFATAGIKFDPEDSQYFDCKAHPNRKSVVCENKDERPGVQFYKYAVDVSWLPLLDPLVVRI
jgi:hypothetical protein